MPYFARRATLAGSAFGEAQSQLSGRNKRQSTAADAASEARWVTHAEVSPSLRGILYWWACGGACRS
ncbi:hypothetical protein SCANM63S_06389 [Streptomyces canarius]